MEASGYQAKRHGLYPEGARLLVKTLVGMHVWAGRYACIQAHVLKEVEWEWESGLSDTEKDAC